jgi:predicted ATPase
MKRYISLRDQNAAAVVRICNHLDGIPLAIELAAAWVNLLQPEQIATRLEANFNLLTGHSPYRMYHQTIRKVLRSWKKVYVTLNGPRIAGGLLLISTEWAFSVAVRVTAKKHFNY